MRSKKFRSQRNAAYKKRLEDLGLFHLEKGRWRRGLIKFFKYLMYGFKESGDRLGLGQEVLFCNKGNLCCILEEISNSEGDSALEQAT